MFADYLLPFMDASSDEDTMSKTNERPPSLHRLVKQSEEIKDLVEQCAADLSQVNDGIADELRNHGATPAVESALSKNMQIEDDVQEASEKLAEVRDGLEQQVRDRTLLDHQFAAALEQKEAARHAALYDALTDLPNRALYDDRLAHGLAQAARHGWALAVMFIDLNDFKGFNDSYGHGVGDRVLQAIGQRLKHNTRSDDTVSRYGGDEFLYLLMEVEDEVHVALVAEKIIETIQKPWGEEERDLQGLPHVTGSVGIAIFPRDGVAADTLMKNADAAMYVAKRNKMGYAFAGQNPKP